MFSRPDTNYLQKEVIFSDVDVVVVVVVDGSRRSKQPVSPLLYPTESLESGHSLFLSYDVE